jgi:hypothetical protein
MNREEIGRAGGTATYPEKFSAADVATYFKGCEFPIDKTSLLECVRSNNPPEHIMSWMDKLPDKEYAAPADVEKAWGGYY